MGLAARGMNVGRGERIFRFAAGLFLMAVGVLTSAATGLILGLLGAALMVTAIFGY